MCLVSLSGCSDDGLDAVFACDIPENPKTLDPQQVGDPNSAQIVLNVFMGLMRYGADGSVEYGAIESYTRSDDGLTYDFKLREDVCWTNCEGFSSQCTAKDYVFGFRRLFSPSTKAPRANEYLCIKNAEQLLSGKTVSENSFGVKALSDFELEITLNVDNPRFLQLLCEAPAMPCNEEFFGETRGKYGLSAECTPSNGAFYVRQWHFDPYAYTDVNNVILARNSKNAEAFDVSPSAVKFFIEDKEDFIGDFLSGDTNCIAASNEERSKFSGNYNCEEFSSITVGLMFNENYSLFKNADFRKALAFSIPTDKILQNLKDFEAADGIVPKRTTVSGENYRENVGSCKTCEYDANAASEYFKNAKSSIDTTLLRGARIITKSTDAFNAAQYIVQEWQRLGFYCQLEQLSESEFISRLSAGTYEIAVSELTGGYDSPEAYLEQIPTALLDEDVISILDYSNPSESDISQAYFTAEQILINNIAFIPLYYKNQYFFTYKEISGIIYNPFTKTIDFSHGKMK